MAQSHKALPIIGLILTVTRFSNVLGACSFGEDEFNGNCYWLSMNKLNWLLAERQCQTAAGGHLTSVGNAIEASYLQGLLSSADLNVDDAWSGGNNLNGGTWEQADGTIPFWCNWSPGYPHNNTDEGANCIALDTARARCSNQDCSTAKHFICKFSNTLIQTTVVRTTTTPPPCPIGYIIWNGACYKATVNIDYVTWQEAEAMCARDRAQLVSIHSNEENDFVNGLIANLTGGGGCPSTPMVLNNAWIGLNDPSQSGQFQWSDGTTFNYNNWAPDEPNNACDHDEYCVEFWKSNNWNDRSCSTLNAGYVCKKQMQ